tara:strand:- start:6836 stop:9178 length:2343 start_codon:yes stop_codon:yes gene_type:complete
MSIPYNTYNGTKCLLLPDSMKNCKAMAKSDNTDKQKYTFESKNNKIALKNGENKYCCDSASCDCISKDEYYYSKITSVVILDNLDRTNMKQKGAFSQTLNGHYVISQGEYGHTENENKVDKKNINMSGNIGNIYKKDKNYLYNNFFNEKIEELKKKELEKEFSWRIYNLNGNGLQCYENVKKEDFTKRFLRGKNANGKKVDKNWVDDYKNRRSFLEDELQDSLPKSLMTIPKMVKWAEVRNTGDEIEEIEKYPIFRFIVDTNITSLNIDGFKTHIDINGQYILTTPLYPYMDGTPAPVFKKGDIYIWYIPFMDKNAHQREWNTNIKKFSGDVFSCFCIQKIKKVDGIDTLIENYCYSNNTGINGMKGEFIPRSGVWSEMDIDKKIKLTNVSVNYGGNEIETFTGNQYGGIKNIDIQNYDSLNIMKNKNEYEHFDGLLLEDNINTIENFETEKETEQLKIEVGGKCQKNTDCVTELCDIEGKYGCENRCLRDINTIDKDKPAAYNCPSNFLELDKYYNGELEKSNDKIDIEKNKADTEIKMIKQDFNNYKKGFYKHVDKNIDSKMKHLEKVYEPDNSINLKNTKKSLVQNYLDTLIDFGKEQNGTLDVDKNTIGVADDMIGISENNMDKNSDDLIKIQNELDTIKRQSSIGLDSILKRSNLEDFFKMLVIYLLLFTLFVFLQKRNLMSNTIKKYVLFIISVLFVGLVIFRFSGIQNRSGHSYANKEFTSDKNVTKNKNPNENNNIDDNNNNNNDNDNDNNEDLDNDDNNEDLDNDDNNDDN